MEKGSPEWIRIKEEMVRRYGPEAKGQVLTHLSIVDPMQHHIAFYNHREFLDYYLIKNGETGLDEILKVIEMQKRLAMIRFHAWWGYRHPDGPEYDLFKKGPK